MADERLEIREDILKVVTSPQAAHVSRQLTTAYIRLVRAPHHLWEGENVLRLTGETREGRQLSAWDQLIALMKVSAKTAKRVIAFLHRERVIAYYTTDDRSEIVISFEGVSRRGSGS
jgi:hypothetical protein